jgi:hypothetical protein
MLRGTHLGIWGLSLASLIASAAPADACMFGRRRTVQTTANYMTANYTPACSTCSAAPAVAVAAVPVATPVVASYCAPQPVAVQETRMVQRCYLAPVTTMQQQTQYENVTTYKTELYDEAVTTMQTSAYYDPCGCGYKAVTTPVTSVVRKSRTVPVTQTIARNYMVPVTTYEQRVALEPVTETKLYYPAAPAVPVAHYVAPTAVAAPVAPVANYVAPAPVAAGPAVAQYLPPAPQAAAAPPAQAPQGQPQFYQSPAREQDNRTLIIERVIQNGQVVQENKRYLAPGEPVPPAQQPAPAQDEVKPLDSTNGWQSSPIRPMPAGRTVGVSTRLSASLEPAVANSQYYR